MVKFSNGLFRELRRTRILQYMAAFSSSASVTAYAMYTSWPSPTLPILTGPDSPLERPMTHEEASWAVSCFVVAGLPLSIVLPFLMNRFGNRKVLLFTGLSFFVPWLIIIFVKHIAAVYVARCLAGFSSAFIGSSVPIYIGEVSDEDIRGKLVTSVGIMKLFGALITLSVGPFVSYDVMAIIAAIVPLAFITLFVFMPESPYDLVRRGDREGAVKVLQKLSGADATESNGEQLRTKLVEIERHVRSQVEYKESFYKCFTAQEFRKTMGIMLAMKSIQLFSGTGAVDAYMQTIIESSSSIISPQVSSIIFGIIQFPAVAISSLVVDRLGRRPVLIISCIGCAISLFAEGLYFFFQDYLESDTSAISWLPTVGIVCYIVSFNFGLLPLPFVLLSELFPSSIKSTAVTSLTVYAILVNFVVAKTFSPMSIHLGMYSAFWFYAAVCVLGALFIYFVLPETKGRTLEQIQVELGRKRRRSQ